MPELGSEGAAREQRGRSSGRERYAAGRKKGASVVSDAPCQRARASGWAESARCSNKTHPRAS